MWCKVVVGIFFTASVLTAAEAAAPEGSLLRDLPPGARPAFTAEWSAGKIDPAKWYALRKRWGEGNRGVVPENVYVTKDTIDGADHDVLVCEAHGDAYDGPVVGEGGAKTRVGGVIVSKPFFA